MAEFRMPSLGADMESGVLVEWLVHPGDAVHRGDPVAVVDTDKAAIEVECFASGTVARLLVEPGTRVPVGAVLAEITGTAAEPATEAAAPPSPPSPVAPAPSGVAPGGSPVTSPLVRRLAHQRHVDLHGLAGTGVGGRITHADVERAGAAASHPAAAPPQSTAGRVKASPRARRLAAELGIDLASVHATGRAGAVESRDVQAAADRAAPAGDGDRTAATRAAVAALMTRSKREVPHYYLAETVDLAAASAWLHERNRKLPVQRRLVPAVLLLKAAACAAAEVPALNGFWVDKQFVPGAGVHLGVAVALRGGGLVAPAIRDADRMELPDLMAALRDLVSRTRAGRLRSGEMSDPTITASNLGDQGAESIQGVIYPPQVALVGFGRITEQVRAVDGLIAVRPTVTVSLAADHRATDGATGSRFLLTVARLLQTPEEL